MTQSLFLFGVSAVCLTTVFFLFLINRLLKSSKSKLEKLLIFVLIPIMALTGYLGARSFLATRSTNNSHLYMAYRYLGSGNMSMAVDKAESVLSVEPGHVKAFTVRMLAGNLEGQYERVKAEISGFLLHNKVSAAERKTLDKVLEVAEKGGDSSTEEELQAVRREVSLLAQQQSIQSVPDDKTVDKLDNLFEIEQGLENQEDIGRLKEQVTRLAVENPEDLEIKKLEAKVALKAGDMSQAAATAREIAVKEDSLENRILLTDVYAEDTRQAVNAGTEPDISLLTGGAEGEEPEVKRLLDQIAKLTQQFSDLDNKKSGTTDEKQQIKLQSEQEKIRKQINDLRMQIRTLPIMRSINYMERARPLTGSDGILYDLQLSKLYYAADLKEKAKELLKRVLDQMGGEMDSFGMKAILREMQNIIDQNPGEVDTQALVPKATEMVERLGGGAMEVQGGNLNEEYRDFVVSHLKYSHVDLFINRIDVSRYPQVTACINVGTDKTNLLGMKREFGKQDFQVEDTDFEIENFELIKNVDRNINICLVFDKSGSMQGRPIADAQAAGVSFTGNIGGGQKVAVAAFDTGASMVCGLTDDKTTLENAIHGIYADGGTNIAGGLDAAIGTLQSSVGGKAIILLSDGVDENAAEGAIENSIRSAMTNGIPVYTVGFGEIDEAYLTGIAESTGGRFFRASSTAELVDIYSILQKYILNNYSIQYTVTKNAEVQDRLLHVKMNGSDGEGSREYSLGQPEGDPGDGTGMDQLVDFLTSDAFVLTGVTNGSVCSKDVNKDIAIEINGRNIPGDVKIKFGSKLSPDVRVAADGSSVKARLPSNLAQGEYDVTGITPDGKVSKLYKALIIYKEGALTSLKVGEIEVKAASIEAEGPGRFVARGNVRFNEVVRAAGEVTIIAQNEMDGGRNEYEAGEITGNGKIYMIFSNSQNTFVAQILKGKDLTVAKGGFFISTRKGNDSELKSDKGLYMDLWAVSFEAGTVSVMQNGLQLKVVSFGFDDFGNENAIKRLTQSLKCFPLEGELTFRATEKDILTKAKVNFAFNAGERNKNKKMKIPHFPAICPAEAGMELDTIGPERKLELTGKFGLPIGKSTDLEFKYSAWSENLILPDEITVKLTSDMGIKLPPAGLVSLDGLGIGAGTIYDAILKKDLMNLSIIGIADVSVGKSPISIPFIGEVKLVSFEDLKAAVKLNLSRFKFSGKVKLLGKEMVEGEALMENKGQRWDFEVKCKGKLELGLVICDIAQSGEFVVSATSDGLLLERSGALSLTNHINGEAWSGSGSFRFTCNDYVSTISLTFTANEDVKRFRIAFDRNTNFFNLKEKIDYEF